MTVRTIRAYVDGAPTPHATIVLDAAEERYALPLSDLAPGVHTVETTGQLDGDSESPRAGPVTVVIAAAQLPAPIAVEGATLAKAIGLRAAMRSRFLAPAQGGESISAGPMYSAFGTFLNDYEFTTQPVPGLAGRERLRGVIDAYAAHIGEFLDPVTSQPVLSVPSCVGASGTVTRWQMAGRWLDFAKAANFAMLVTRCHKLGDSTVWGTHKEACELALLAFPEVARGGGTVHHSDEAQSSYFWWDEGGLAQGDIISSGAEFCRAYLAMKEVATALGDTASASAYQARIDAFTLGLRTARIASGEYAGFYPSSTYQGLAHIGTTAAVVALGLCDSTERAASASALVSMYLAGRLTMRGWVKQLVDPLQYVGGEAYGVFQNGGYWSAETIPSYLARSFQLAGRDDLAAGLYQDAVDEFLRQHRYNRLAPWEWIHAGLAPTFVGADFEVTPGNLQAFEVGFLADTREGLPGSIDLTISGALGSEVTQAFPHGHLIRSVEVIAGQASTVTVDLLGNEPGRASSGSTPAANAAYVPMASVALANAVSGTASDVPPIAAFGGGGVKAKVAAGSAAGNLTVRLHMAPVIPDLAAPTLPAADEFALDTSADYRLYGDAAWAFGGGVAAQSGTGAAHSLLRSVPPVPDARLGARVLLNGTRPARLYLRWRDEQNWLAIELRTTGVYLVKRSAGTESTVASYAITVATGTYHVVEARAASGTIEAWLNTTKRITFTAADIHAGLVGFGTAAGTGTVSFDRVEVLSRTHYVPPGFLVDAGIPTGCIHDDDTSQLGVGIYSVRSPEGAVLGTAYGTGLVAG